MSTNLELDDILAQTNELQDRMLEKEDGASSDFEDPDEDTDAEYNDDRRMGAAGSPYRPCLAVPTRTPSDPPVASTVVTWPVGPTQDDNGPEESKPSRSAQRRKRKRQINPAELRSERLARGRVKKARREAVETGLKIHTLKPGLKLPDGCEKKVYSLAELLGKGFVVHRWDGL